MKLYKLYTIYGFTFIDVFINHWTFRQNHFLEHLEENNVGKKR